MRFFPELPYSLNLSIIDMQIWKNATISTRKVHKKSNHILGPPRPLIFQHASNSYPCELAITGLIEQLQTPTKDKCVCQIRPGMCLCTDNVLTEMQGKHFTGTLDSVSKIWTPHALWQWKRYYLEEWDREVKALPIGRKQQRLSREILEGKKLHSVFRKIIRSSFLHRAWACTAPLSGERYFSGGSYSIQWCNSSHYIWKLTESEGLHCQNHFKSDLGRLLIWHNNIKLCFCIF